MNNAKENCIGVFDSGIGGLTVVRQIQELLPREKIIYFGDTARVPYGIKSEETIIRYAKQISAFLLQHPVKLLIIACNSMSATAYEEVVKMSPVPVIEVIDAGARCAARITRNNLAGVIATPTTIRSGAYSRALKKYNKDINIRPRACPLFVPLVEEGWLDNDVAHLAAHKYLDEMLESNIDTLVLGCTHYPLLKPMLQKITGPGVRLIDSAQAVSAMALDLLRGQGMLRESEAKPKHQFFVSDAPEHFKINGERFLATELEDVRLVCLPEIKESTAKAQESFDTAVLK